MSAESIFPASQIAPHAAELLPGGENRMRLGEQFIEAGTWEDILGESADGQTVILGRTKTLKDKDGQVVGWVCEYAHPPHPRFGKRALIELLQRECALLGLKLISNPQREQDSAGLNVVGNSDGVLTENQHGGQRSISHDNARNTESPAIKQEQGGAL